MNYYFNKTLGKDFDKAVEHVTGNIEVSAVDPISSMISENNEALGSLSVSIQQKLKRSLKT